MPIDIKLHAAICDGDFKTAHELVKTRPDLAKGRDEEKGETLLHRMAVYDVVNDALQAESKSASHKDLKSLLSELIKNDYKRLLVKNKQGRTALSLAINPPSGQAKKEMVFYLLKECPHAAKLQDKENHTALHHAIFSGNFDVIQTVMQAFHGALQKKDKLGQIPLATALRLYLDIPTDVRMSILRQLLDFTVTSGNAKDVLIRVQFNGDFYGQDLWEYATDFCIEVGEDTSGKKTFKPKEYLIDFVKDAARSLSSQIFGAKYPDEALNYVMSYASKKFDETAFNLFKAVIEDGDKREHRTTTLASTNRHVRKTGSVNLRTLKPLLKNSDVNTSDEKKESVPSSMPSVSTPTSAPTNPLHGLSLMRKKKQPVPVSITLEDKRKLSLGTKTDSDPSTGIELSPVLTPRG